MDLENAFLSERFSDLSRTEVGMLEFVLSDFILILACKSLGMGVDSMGFVFQTFDVAVAFSQQLEIMIDSAEGNACFFIDLFRSFLTLQDGTNYFIPLKCIHSFASII
jgi:hypothetical protein